MAVSPPLGRREMEAARRLLEWTHIFWLALPSVSVESVNPMMLMLA